MAAAMEPVRRPAEAVLIAPARVDNATAILTAPKPPEAAADAASQGRGPMLTEGRRRRQGDAAADVTAMAVAFGQRRRRQSTGSGHLAVRWAGKATSGLRTPKFTRPSCRE